MDKNTSTEQIQELNPVSQRAKITLLKPITFEEREVKAFCLDFDALNRNVLLAAERKYYTNGGPNIPVKALSDEYCEYVAAEIADEPHALIMQLGATDYLELTTLVQSFLLGMPLSTEPA